MALKTRRNEMNKYHNSMSLKWGTMKSWDFKGSKEAGKLLNEYANIGYCFSRAMQNDSPRQKEILCELIDLCDSVYLDWDDEEVTREEAKDYIMNDGC